MGTAQSREHDLSDSDYISDKEESSQGDSQDNYQDATYKQPQINIDDVDAKLKALKLKYASPSPSSSSAPATPKNAVNLYLHIGGNTPKAKWIISNKLTTFSFVKTANVDGDSDDDEYGAGPSGGTGQWILKVGGFKILT